MIQTTVFQMVMLYKDCHPDPGFFLQFWGTLQWRHNGPHGVSNHQPHYCLLNPLFRRRSKKISELCVTGLFAGNSPVTTEFPHKWPVTRKMFTFDDSIMKCVRPLAPLQKNVSTDSGNIFGIGRIWYKKYSFGSLALPCLDGFTFGFTDSRSSN